MIIDCVYTFIHGHNTLIKYFYFVNCNYKKKKKKNEFIVTKIKETALGSTYPE